MLFPAQVIPFLNHEDSDVRLCAADYLAELAERAPDVAADALWRAVDAYGERIGQLGLPEHTRYFGALEKVPANDASITRAVDALRIAGPDSDAQYGLNAILNDVPLELLARRQEEILAAVGHDKRDHLQQRLALRSLTAEELWQQFVTIGDAAAADEHSGKVDSARAERLVEALAAHAEFAIPRAIAVLQDGRDRYWLETWCIDLLGRLGHSPSADLVVEKMENDDGDFMHTAATYALARMDPTIAVPRLEASWASDDIYHRMRVAEALGACMHPLAEAAMVRLLPGEADGEVVAVLAGKLCELCATEGLEELRQVVVEDRYDGSIQDVTHDLVTLSKMVGFAPPEMEEWKKELADQGRRQKRRKAFWGKMVGTGDESERLFNMFTPKPGGNAAFEQRAVEQEPVARQNVTMPVRRESPKIGRNEPCPCGSGKKYKKCCGAG